MIGPFLLAQYSAADAAVQALPPPPTLQHHLFEAPLMPAAVLVVLGIGLFAGFNRAGNPKRGLILGLALVLLGAAVAATGYLVTTERERLADRMTELVNAVAAPDPASLSAMLDEHAETRFRGILIASGRQPVVNRVERELTGRAAVSEHTVSRRTAHLESSRSALTQAHVRVSPRNYPGRYGTWFRVRWVRSDESSPWLAESIECLHIDGVPAGVDVRP